MALGATPSGLFCGPQAWWSIYACLCIFCRSLGQSPAIPSLIYPFCYHTPWSLLFFNHHRHSKCLLCVQALRCSPSLPLLVSPPLPTCFLVVHTVFLLRYLLPCCYYCSCPAFSGDNLNDLSCCLSVLRVLPQSLCVSPSLWPPSIPWDSLSLFASFSSSNVVFYYTWADRTDGLNTYAQAYVLFSQLKIANYIYIP